MRRMTVLVVAVAACIVGPVVADAKKKPPKPKPPAVGHEKCEQAVTEKNGPIESAEVTATRACFKELQDGLDATSVPAGVIAQTCRQAKEADRDAAADVLSSVAKGWQRQLDATKKAKAGYFKRESDWYATNGPKSTREENVRRVDAVVDAIGKAGLDISGYYAEMESEASAERNADCADVQTHYQGLLTRIQDLTGKFEALNTALKNLP